MNQFKSAGALETERHVEDRGGSLVRGALLTCILGTIVGIFAVVSGCDKSAPAGTASVQTQDTTISAAGTTTIATQTISNATVSAPAKPETPPAPHPDAGTPPTVTARESSIHDLDLSLETQAGTTMKIGDLRGHPVIVSMFYASCPAVCPTLIRDIKRIDESLSPATRETTRVLLVTFDPLVDTPEKLASLAANHGIDTSRWTLARAADDDATRELATALGIRYRAVEDGHFNHTSIITLLDRHGVPLARIDGLNQDHTAFLATLAALP